jgi:hypothetical protein
MLLKDTETGDLVQVDDLAELLNPRQHGVQARVQAGQEEQAAEMMGKERLVFPSGERLPRCWSDPSYRQATP